jgi:hypothetical protein
MTPVHTTVQPTCAAGRPSIITGTAPQNGQGTGAAGPMTPHGTS